MHGMIRGCLAALAAVGWVVTAQAQTKPNVTGLSPHNPKSVIFIGNSYFYSNNGMPHHLGLLEKAADPEHKQDYHNTMVTIGGAALDWHDVESYFRPDGIGESSVDEPNTVVFAKPRTFDAAVMMDCSQCPIHPKRKSVFTEYARKDADIVRSHGTTPIFFMTWAYADRPEMTALLAEAYTANGNANNALVIPAGLAFARARERQPEIDLYAPDKQHPSLAGTYLAACTTYAALTGKSPVGNSYVAGLDAQAAKFLQEIAWETAQDYYGK